MKRVFLIVLDSFGIGAMEDSASYGDIDVNTLKTVSSSPFFRMPHMEEMGLFRIDGVGEALSYKASGSTHTAAIARMRERSRGKEIGRAHV